MDTEGGTSQPVPEKHSLCTPIDDVTSEVTTDTVLVLEDTTETHLTPACDSANKESSSEELVESVHSTGDGNVLENSTPYTPEDRVVGVDEAEGEVRCLRGHEQGVWSVCVSADGRYIVSGSDDCTVRVWDAHTGTPLHTLVGHTGGVYSVCISRDGSTIASGSADKSVRVWDTGRWSVKHILYGHEDKVNVVTISSCKTMAVTGSADATARVWDLPRGAFRFSLVGHKLSVSQNYLSLQYGTSVYYIVVNVSRPCR